MTETLTKINKPRPVTPLGILVEELERTLKIAKQENVSAELANSLKKVYELAAGIDPYLEENTTQESPELSALAKKTAAEDWSKRFDDGETVRQLEQEMLSGHIEGQTLKMFVSMTKAKRILEIGMFTGYSALAMAEALPADGDIIACEVDEYVSEFAKECFENSEHGKKIKVVTAPAIETLKKLIADGETFDLVFIDADKPGYVDYFNLLIETNLLAKDGFICVDNTLLQGQPYLPKEKRTANGEAIAKFNQTVTQDPRVEQVILPLRDGLTIIKRK
ncbi:class I SAM-dependent methyltransferase [Sphaerospermopsis kisseleviana CS-549]|uniref:Caffeoyl-CoA O-methyltransferase n=2 Tax=Sphaerospermopsis TaxID=752201 RepID=A0A480A1Y7_9CYAN|nr:MULTISPECIES: class I SAM-dependent methyltransferase [Sphaerospermopsis]MDB9442866.1 class I SAM-dependent methyltransferase [Sphaerospermopsis kisseleviana CS-549]BAZ79748.1 caffeoyl-CoA O-methyltransferase [Sphaerospermopsis kisseleviana NIES-73]GCL37806.1 caffeoyl-CoA O-methyltransferase [Sphaerospermopsis reniformis]